MTRRSRIAQPPLIVSQTESLKHVHVKTFSDGFRVWHPLVRNYVGDQTMSPFRTMQAAARRAREIELEVLTSGGVPSDGPSRSTTARVDPRQGGFKFNDFYSSGSYDPDDPRPARRASHQHHHHGDAMPIGRAVDYSEAQHHHGHHTPSYDYEAISALKPNPYVVAERRGRPAIDVVFPKRTEAGLARRYIEGSEGATGLRVRAATPAEVARLRKENPGRGRTLPATVERCVAHVGPRRVEEFGPREGLSSAIAICTAQGQRRGQLRKGTRKPTKKGRRDQRNARRRVGFAAAERAVARMARAARKANGVDGLTLTRAHGYVSAEMTVGPRVWSAVYDPASQAGDVSLNGEDIGGVAGPQRLGDGSYDFGDYHATVSLSDADSDAFDVFRARLAKALLASAAKRPRKGAFRPTRAMPTVDLWDRIPNGSRRWTSPAVDRDGRDVVIEYGVDIDGQHVEAWAAEWREGWPNIREVARFTGTMREATEGLRAWHQKAMVA